MAIRIKETDSQITRKAMLAIARGLNEATLRAVAPIKRDVQNLTRRSFYNSPEYDALVNGPLDGEFGFEAGSAVSRVNRIIEEFVQGVQVKHTKVVPLGESFKGGITVEVVRDDFNDVLSLDEAKVHTDKGETLEWLEWLLLKGNRIIIGDYHVVEKPFKQSRSGKALMFKNSAYRVNAQYSGTRNVNWVTRTLLGFGRRFIGEVDKIIENNITKASASLR